MQRRFLLQILLLAQHVSGTTMPIIRSSRVLYSGCCLWYFVLWFFKLLVWCGAEGYVSGLQDAAAEKSKRRRMQNHSLNTNFIYQQQAASYLMWF